MTDGNTPTARSLWTSTLSRVPVLCVFVVACLLGTASALQAATVQWNPIPNRTSPATSFSYGTQTGVYTTSVDAGNVTTWNLTLTPGCSILQSSIQAYNTGGLYVASHRGCLRCATGADADADVDEPLAIERSTSRDGRHDQRQQFRLDSGDQHRHVQRHRRDADDLVREQHRRPRPSRARPRATSSSPSAEWRATRCLTP